MAGPKTGWVVTLTIVFFPLALIYLLYHIAKGVNK